MRDNMEVIQTEDKDQRDRLYEDLKRHGNELERKVVKFSDVRELAPVNGKRKFISVWCVSYPKS